MKKQVFYTLAATVLLSSSLLSTLNVQADETEPTKDSATSTAKITFTGGNDDPVDPLIPDNPDDHGSGDHGPLSIDHVTRGRRWVDINSSRFSFYSGRSFRIKRCGVIIQWWENPNNFR